MSEQKRINIYDKNSNLIAQDYQRNNLEWMHKWYNSKNKKFEFSWRGRAKCDNKEYQNSWEYKEIEY